MNWKAEWIHLPGQQRNKGSAPVPYLRKVFPLEKHVTRAIAKITALGLYELWINGQRVGDVQLAPGWTDYRTRLHCQEYDVTGLLRVGENVIGVKLGDGWYGGRMFITKRQFYGVNPELLFDLSMETSEGPGMHVCSDASWKASEGAILSSDLYDGEDYDARQELPGWDLPGFDDSSWKEVASRPLQNEPIIEVSRHEPVRIIEELSPQRFYELEPGRWVFDLGQNMVGRARIAVHGEKGRCITLRFAEMLEKDGRLYTENYRSAQSIDRYTCHGRGDIETWEPVFTFHGFRYVELSGLPENVQPDSTWVTGIVLHNDMPQTGTFACSHPLLNQLQNNILWGQKGNFLEVPTDCPQRDERLGWTGDAQVFCPTACFNFNAQAFFHKWMQDVRDAQRENGLVPWVVPDGFGEGDCESAAWGDAVAIVPWEVYIRFGDLAILEENYPAIGKWIDFQKSDSPGLIRADRGFGDWLQPYAKNEDPLRGDTQRSLIGTAYFAYTADLASRIAVLLGHSEEAAEYAGLAREVRQAFVKTFWTEENRLSSDTQTAYLLALAFDLLPVEKVQEALQNLLRLIAEADGHLRTGFVGTPLLLPTLTRFGRVDLAYELLLKETYPGWLFSIHQGATTLWERWNSYSHRDGFGDATMNSFNHYAYGAVGQWMYETVAGLVPDPEHPGYRHFFVQPVPGGGLRQARAELLTAHGRCASGWRLEDQALIIEAEVPEGTTATVVFPSGTPANIFWQGTSLEKIAIKRGPQTALRVGPGSHRFCIKEGGVPFKQ
jgi:alpha-L-rhamnosidase